MTRPVKRLPDVLLIALLSLAYFCAALGGLKLASLHGVAAPVWPPAGIALATLLLFGRHLWPGVAFGAFAANLVATKSTGLSLCIAFGNTLEALVAWELLTRAKFRSSFKHSNDVFSFIGITSLVSTPLSATIGVGASHLFDVIPYPELGAAWVTWWLGDFLGDLVVATFLLVWSNRPRRTRPSLLRTLEAIGLTALITALSALLFIGISGFTFTPFLYPYALFPLILWATYRFGQRGTVTTILIVFLIATVGTVTSLGPFGELSKEDPIKGLLGLQTFIGVMTTTFLVFGALVAESRHTLVQLKRSENRFRRLVEADIIGVFFWKIDGEILEPNTAFLNMLDFSRTEYEESGLDWRNLTHADFREKSEKAVQELQTQGVSQAYEKDFLNRRGLRVPTMIGSAMIDSDEGIGVSFVLDMTEAKKNLSNLEKAVKDREEIVAIVSHDLKNPLGSILLNTQLLRKTAVGQPTIIRQAERIERATSRMQGLIENILDVTRIEAGNLTLDFRPENAQTLIEEAAEIPRTLAEEKSVELVTRSDSSSIVVYCDHVRTLQVLSNLIGNAIKFTPPGGRITISVTGELDQAQITVSDTGPGIPQDQVSHIFDRYWQAKKREGQGIGLGLSIAKGIVEAHQGRIWVESRPGSGTSFHFTLPTTRRATALPFGRQSLQESATDEKSGA